MLLALTENTRQSRPVGSKGPWALLTKTSPAFSARRVVQSRQHSDVNDAIARNLSQKNVQPQSPGFELCRQEGHRSCSGSSLPDHCKKNRRRFSQWSVVI